MQKNRKDETTSEREAASRTDASAPEDVRGEVTKTADRSLHRRHHWLYEDLLN